MHTWKVSTGRFNRYLKADTPKDAALTVVARAMVNDRVDHLGTLVMVEGGPDALYFATLTLINEV